MMLNEVFLNKNNKDMVMRYYLDYYFNDASSRDISQKYKDVIIKNNKEILSEKLDYIGFVNRKIDKIQTYKYSDDVILNYLNYWRKYRDLKKLGIFKVTEIDKLWLIIEHVLEGKISNDLLNNELILLDKELRINKISSRVINMICKKVNADTIFSVWGPLKHSFELIGIKVNKNEAGFLKIANNLSLMKKEAELYNVLIKFVEVASSRGNVCEYPYSRLEKVSFQKRGSYLLYNDLFLISLAQCFEGGRYANLFNADKEKANFISVSDWVEKQNLKMFFQNEVVNKDKLINIGIQNSKMADWSSVTKISDMIKILRGYIKIIEKRNEIYSKEYF